MTKYSEIHNTNFDENQNYWTIDAWVGDEEEGTVVAVVNGTTEDVWYCDPDARNDEGVQEAITELLIREF